MRSEVYSGMERIKVTNARLMEIVREAKAMPGMRIGQHVCNTLFFESGEDTSRLFYCSDAAFWETVTEFVEILD